MPDRYLLALAISTTPNPLHAVDFSRYVVPPKASVLAQRRTGNGKLKDYLHGIGADDSDLCDECGQKETVKHVLLDCRRWTEERKELRAAIKDRSRWGNVPYLLGGWSGRRDPTGKLINEEASAWKPQLAVVKATIEFAMKTGRFKEGER